MKYGGGQRLGCPVMQESVDLDDNERIYMLNAESLSAAKTNFETKLRL